MSPPPPYNVLCVKPHRRVHEGKCRHLLLRLKRSITWRTVTCFDGVRASCMFLHTRMDVWRALESSLLVIPRGGLILVHPSQPPNSPKALLAGFDIEVLAFWRQREEREATATRENLDVGRGETLPKIPIFTSEHVRIGKVRAKTNTPPLHMETETPAHLVHRDVIRWLDWFQLSLGWLQRGL